MPAPPQEPLHVSEPTLPPITIAPSAPASTATLGPTQARGLWTRDFVLLLVSSMLFFTGFHLLLSSMPVYAVRLGGAEATAGMVGAAVSLSALLVRPFSGWVVDVTGRKIILLLGTGFVLVSILAHQWVTGVALLLALRFAHGIGFGVATTASGTLASDLVPRLRLGEGMGFFTMSMSLPMVAAPALGIYLASRGDFSLLFLLAAGLTAASLAIAFLLRPLRVARPTDHRGRGRGPSIRGMYEPNALFASVLVLLLTGTYGLLLALIALHGERRGIANVGLFFTVYAVVLTSTRAWAGRLADRWGYRPMAALGLAVSVVGLLVLAAAGNLAVLFVAAALYGFGFGSAQPSMQAMALERASPSRRGAATAMFFTAFDVGVVVGSLTGGFLAGALSLGGVIALSGVMPLVGLALLFMNRRRQPAPSTA